MDKETQFDGLKDFLTRVHEAGFEVGSVMITKDFGKLKVSYTAGELSRRDEVAGQGQRRA